MASRTTISFALATGLHVAALAALDAGWLLPAPVRGLVTCECEVELVTVVPDTPAVPLPMAPEPPPAPAPAREPPLAAVPETAPPPEPKVEPPPPPAPEPQPPPPKMEPDPPPPPEPPPAPKPERRPEPGPTLESRPKPITPAPIPRRVAAARPPAATTPGPSGGGAAGSATAATSGVSASAATDGHGTGPALAFPAYLSNPEPYYPTQARRNKQEGLVLLDVAVNASGKATHVEIARSSGHPLLDESALKTVRRWRFKPARLGDRPVDSHVQVPIRFRLDR